MRLDLLMWDIYEKYTTSEFHSESVECSVDDNTSDRNEDESGYDENKVNMLEDPCGAAGMNLGVESGNDIETMCMNSLLVKQQSFIVF